MRASALFGEPQKSTIEVLADAIQALQDRLHKADAWFADPSNTDHPRFEEFGRAAEQISRELGDLTSKAYELGLYWDGERLVPWADAFNQAAVTFVPDKPPAFAGTQVIDLSDLE